MINKFLKIAIALISFLIILLIFRIILPIYDLYAYKLTDEYYLVGVGNKKYEIRREIFGKPIISNITLSGEWIITPNEIYGIKGNPGSIDDDYFFLGKSGDAIAVFDDLYSLNQFLKEKGFEEYSMLNSEKVVHLKIDRRKF